MKLIVLIATLWSPQPGMERPPPVPCCADESIRVTNNSILNLEDATDSLTLAEVRSPELATRWFANEDRVPSKGYVGNTHWFHFSVLNTQNIREVFMAEFSWPVMEEVDAYVVQQGESAERISSFFCGERS